jgi:hypothetical protein
MPAKCSEACYQLKKVHIMITIQLIGTVSRDFLLLVFFLNQFPPAPFIPFQFFRKFAEIVESQDAPPVSMTPVAHLPPVSLLPVSTTPDTGGKFFHHFR